MAFVADGGGGAVAGMDDGGVWELHEFVFERGDEFVEGAAPEVGAADAAGEERVAGKELRLSQRGVLAFRRQIQRNTSRGVPRGVNDVGEEVAPLEGVTFFEKLVNFDEFGRANTKKCGLNFHAAIKGKIVGVHHDGSTRVLIELCEAADVVNVRVGADDGFHGEFVAAEKAQDAFDFVAGIDDDALERARIADDGTIALQHSNRDFEIDHLGIARIGHAAGWGEVVHGESISSGFRG
jgi:hypothetical protein